MAGTLPDSSIDFTRPFSLPFGVPPHSVSLSNLATYLAELGVQAEFLQLTWDETQLFSSRERLPSAEHPRNPFSPGRPRIPGRSDRPGRIYLRYIKRSTGPEAVLVPTYLNPVTLATSSMGTSSFRPAAFDLICRPHWTAVVPIGGETMSAAMAKSFRHDEQEKKLWALPQPYAADESLCIYWKSNPVQSGQIGIDIPGIFVDDSSSHLLPTNAEMRNGELQHDLLRSPVRGLARVSRYRHISINESSGTISSPKVLAPSAACAAILETFPNSPDIPSDPRAPLLRQSYVVLDHISVSHASDCFAPLWWNQLLRFSELEEIAEFRKAVRSSLAWGIAVYLSLAVVSPPVVDAFSGLQNETREKLIKVTTSPDLVSLREAITHVLGRPSLHIAFSDFVRETLGALLCGIGWNEIKDRNGINLYSGIPAAPSARTTATKEAHRILESAQQAKDIWVAVYAGAPVGRPSPCYQAPTAGSPLFDIVRNGTTTFDMEALVLSGHITAVFPGISSSSISITPDQQIPLANYAGQVVGSFASARVPDGPPGSPAFTMRDWLRQLIFGWQRTLPVDAPLDFSPMATSNHPLKNTIGYGRRLTAVGLRDSLDKINASTVGSESTLWWSRAVGFSTGINWPLFLPVSGPGVKDASREARNAPPARTGETVGGTLTPSGFDIEDLELVLEARDYLQSGDHTGIMVNPALILALLDREGYRMNGQYMRQGPFDFRFRDDLKANPSSGFDATTIAKRGGLHGLGRWLYALQVYGLDLLDAPHFPTTGIPTDWLKFAWDNLTGLLRNAEAEGTFVGDVADLNGQTLLRVSSRLRSGIASVQSRILSRRVHVGGIVAQHAEFQRRHSLLRRGGTAGKLDSYWQPSSRGTLLPDIDEFTANPVPIPGSSAESLERRDYLAYYALCYLAFNGSPSLWKSWVNRATSLGASSVTNFILYNITDAQSTGGGRELWHRGHFVRFSLALDIYLRTSDSGIGDTDIPIRGAWGV